MAKKPKKSLSQTEYFDKVLKYLAKVHDWDPTDFDRSDIKAMVEAVVQVAIRFSSRKNGCAIPGLGKIFFHFKKACPAGKRKMFGKTVEVGAKPAEYVPKLRPNKAFKDAMAKRSPDSKKKGKKSK